MIFGIRGSGKTTVANYLEENHSYKQFALATRVRKACSAFGIDNPTKADLVNIGTGIGRKQIDNLLWIRLTENDIDTYHSLTQAYDYQSPIVISDIRFPNEYEHFLDKGYFPIHIIGSEEDNIKRVKQRDGYIQEELLQHETETNHNDFTGLKIRNDGSLDDLYNQVDSLVSLLKNNDDYTYLLKVIKKSYKERLDIP